MDPGLVFLPMRRVESLSGFVVAGGVVAVAARSRSVPRWTTPAALVLGTAAGWATGSVLSLTPHKPVVPALIAAGVALIAIAAFTSADAGRAWPALGGLLVTISAFGSYATLPDTERALSLLGAAGAITIAGI